MRLALALLALTGCAASLPPTAETGVTASDLAIIDAAVRQHSRRPLLGALRDVQVYALPDGQRLGCGDWMAPDAYGGPGGYAPFYVRYAGGEIGQVHLDDLTGYGPARTGCLSAAARVTGFAG